MLDRAGKYLLPFAEAIEKVRSERTEPQVSFTKNADPNWARFHCGGRFRMVCYVVVALAMRFGG